VPAKPSHSGPPHSGASDHHGDSERARAAVPPSDALDELLEGAFNEANTRKALSWLRRALNSPRVLLGQIDDYGELVIVSDLREGLGSIRPNLDGVGLASDEWQGVWGRALSELHVLFDNQPHSTGLEQLRYRRGIAAPMRFDGNLIGLAFAVDRATDYGAADQQILAQFARRAAPVFAYTLTQARFQRQLEAAEEMASAAAEGERFFMMSRDPMVITDAGLKRANAAFTTMMGLRPQELQDKSLPELTHPKDREQFERELLLMRTEPNREHNPVAVDMLTKSGEQRRVEWVGAATHDGRVYAVGRDITVLSWAMEDLAITNAELQRLHGEARAEEQLAARVIAHVRRQGHLDTPGIEYVTSPLGFFNGDVQLASYMPDGELRWLLGDFTGHGLAAAIGTVPLAGAFHLACRRKLEFVETIGVINDMLKGVLPPGLFCASAWLALSPDGRELSIWNCGLPAVLVRRGSTGQVEHFNSQGLPLGVVSSSELGVTPTYTRVADDDEVFVFTDGMTECTDASGQQFGIDRAMAALSGGLRPGEGLSTLMRAVASFRGSEQATDDLSALCVSVGLTRAAAHVRGGASAQGFVSSAESTRR
jgi:PAS domain S-box-containing protein